MSRFVSGVSTRPGVNANGLHLLCVCVSMCVCASVQHPPFKQSNSLVWRRPKNLLATSVVGFGLSAARADSDLQSA